MIKIKYRVWAGHMFCPGHNMSKVDYVNKEFVVSSDGAIYITIDEQYYPSIVIADEDVVLMQYIGIKDKGGKDIYEGDLVQITFTDEDTFSNLTIITEGKTYEIKREGTYFGIVFDDGSCGHIDERYVLEVVGNKYENPKLLTK